MVPFSVAHTRHDHYSDVSHSIDRTGNYYLHGQHAQKDTIRKTIVYICSIGGWYVSSKVTAELRRYAGRFHSDNSSSSSSYIVVINIDSSSRMTWKGSQQASDSIRVADIVASTIGSSTSWPTAAYQVERARKQRCIDYQPARRYRRRLISVKRGCTLQSLTNAANHSLLYCSMSWANN